MTITKKTDAGEALRAATDRAIAAAGLTVLESEVLGLRFGRGGSSPLSAEEVAQRLGVTVEEVIDAETAALHKMRGPDAQAALETYSSGLH